MEGLKDLLFEVEKHNEKLIYIELSDGQIPAILHGDDLIVAFKAT
jgi:hypothetical protein